MFDNAFHGWQERRFPQVASMRNMLKSALIWRHGLPATLPAKEVAPLLKKHDVVPPTEWFQAGPLDYLSPAPGRARLSRSSRRAWPDGNAPALRRQT